MGGRTFLVHETGIGWDQESLKIFHPILQNFRSFSTFKEPEDKVTLFLAPVQLILNFPQNYFLGFQAKSNLIDNIYLSIYLFIYLFIYLDNI